MRSLKWLWQQIDRALKTFAESLGTTPDILANNAGVNLPRRYLHQLTPENIRMMLDGNLTAPFMTSVAVLPGMKAKGGGLLIQIASMAGKRVSFLSGPSYIAAKHGLVGLTRTAALEGGEHGITVNAVCPAYVRTPLVDHQIADQAAANRLSPEEVVEKIMLAPAAVKRLIEPAEVADFVAYLCSEPAGVITGAALTMDLGWTAR